MDDDNKKTKQSKLWDAISLWLIVSGFVLGIICLIAGIESLTGDVTFIDALRDILLTDILLPLSIIALLIIMLLLKGLFESHPLISVLLIAMIVIAVPMGSSTIRKSNHSSDNHFTKSAEQTQWNYFEKISRLGDDYKDISNDYGPLSDENVINGGVYLKGSNGLFYAFPKYTKSDITDTDPCTAMAGTVKDLLGYKNSVTVSVFIEDLGLTSETEFEGNLTFKKTSSSGYYYVSILSTDIINNSDLLTPDTWVSVVQRDRAIIPTGSLASDQNATRETVFFVQEGDRYHKDPSCSTLHDSDEIFECYFDEVPEGRSSCGVCY